MDIKSKSAKSGLKRIAVLIAGGVLALSVALPASADNGHDRGNGHAYGKHRNYDDGDYRRPGHRYGHYKRKHRRYDDGDYRRPGRHYGHYKPSTASIKPWTFITTIRGRQSGCTWSSTITPRQSRSRYTWSPAISSRILVATTTVVPASAAAG